MNGIVLVDKPAGCTSHDVVNRWRRLSNSKRVGHLGTLDPMATGLLVLVAGTATRLAQFFGHDDKTYAAEFRLGVVSDTYDAEGSVVETGAVIPEDADVIASALNTFKGRFLQTPPPVSAKKIKGVPAYKYARKQIAVELKPVEVEVKQLDAIEISGAHIRVCITCSSGTYIRGIAHELGNVLGCGALLSSLRRTQVGAFHVENAKSLDELGALASAGRLAEAVISAARLLPQFPSEHFGAMVEAQIRQGRDFRTSPFVIPPGAPYVKALSVSGELVAIGELKIPNLYHPSTVL